MPSQPPHSSDRFASLDQWRGWAMVLVLINHSLKPTGWVEGLGRTGVNLFFVISGILTALSLLSLQRKNKNFWLQLPAKRLWRLWPTLAVFIVALLILKPAIWPTVSFDAVPVILFYTNYIHQSLPLSHLWSISCEMQFYLLSPLLFWLGIKAGWAGKTVLAVISAALLGCGVLYVAIQTGKIDPPFFDKSFYGKYTFQVAVWPMLFGFVWQLYRPVKLVNWQRYRKLLPALVAIFTIALIGALALQNRIATVFVGIAFMPLVIACYETQMSLPGKFGRALVWIGKRTYSIYLVQQLFTIAAPYDSAWWPIGGLVAVPVGGLFYQLVESRFIKKSPPARTPSETPA